LILIGKTERTLLALIGSRREGALPAFIFLGYSTLAYERTSNYLFATAS
jgi:hypothetical protein